MNETRGVVLLTGAAGNLGRSIAKGLSRDYTVVGLDREGDEIDGMSVIEADLTSADSIRVALGRVRDTHGGTIASVVHLAAYFDFTGEDHPLYDKLNVEGTAHLLDALQDFEVGQFVYASTMLVHAPGEPGEAIDEDQPIEPGWAYPKSKAKAEAAIAEHAGTIPHVLLRLAGIYDEATMVPTLAQQVARIYARDFESHFYSGNTDAGQAMLHRDDMVDSIKRTVDRRGTLESGTAILIGEEDALGYDDLQDRLGRLIHGEEEWATIRLPGPIAAAGTWAQAKLEPVIPDTIDQGEEPFIKPFMTRMASDHYALDISRARSLLGWEPRYSLADTLPKIVVNLKNDPLGWYDKNGVTPPDWMTEADEAGFDPHTLYEADAKRRQREHGRFRWAHAVNIALGLWVLTQPSIVDVRDPWLIAAEMLIGAGIVLFATISLSWRAVWARYATAGLGIALMFAPFALWSDNAAAYTSDTLVGMLVFGLALASFPEPGPSPLAANAGPTVPPGWSYNPSGWIQRMPIIALALLGLIVSRYLGAYQLEHVPGVWEPFFAGDPANPQNGTEEIITSDVSKMIPVPDAALGAWVYGIEVVTGLVGSARRWRTMPWLVIAFGILIVPLGIVSIFFIIIQPIAIGTWSTLTLIGASAMLVQIPYSIDELLASLQFVRRRHKAGKNWLRVLFVGDTDEKSAADEDAVAEFDRPTGEMVKDFFIGGVSLPWNLVLVIPIGVALMLSRVTFGTEGTLAHSDHVIGALILTTLSVAAAEVTRSARYFLVPLALALIASPFLFGAPTGAMIFNVAAGVALVVLSRNRGPIRERYGNWDQRIL